ncbi:MAG: hypothetical protein M4579_006766 [Chaenotheca gracillima]|nr:MAG: hypothetical protein M4579_006766 [Chaenotheca gracillima]
MSASTQHDQPARLFWSERPKPIEIVNGVLCAYLDPNKAITDDHLWRYEAAVVGAVRTLWEGQNGVHCRSLETIADHINSAVKLEKSTSGKILRTGPMIPYIAKWILVNTGRKISEQEIDKDEKKWADDKKEWAWIQSLHLLALK